MWIIALILLGLVIGAGFAFVAYADAEEKEELKEIKELEETTRKKKTEAETPEKKKDPHPLEMTRTLASKFDRYVEVVEKRVKDNEYLTRFLVSKDKVESDLRTLSVERLLLIVKKFDPILLEYGLMLNSGFMRLYEEISQLAFSLPNLPENIFALERRTAIFGDFEASITQVDEEYEKFMARGVPLSKINPLLRAGLNTELAQLRAKEEVGKILDFYYHLRIFTLFHGFHEIHQEEIGVEVQELKNCLDLGREGIGEELLRKIEFHQNRLLDFLQTHHTWYHSLYEGIRRGMEMLQDLEALSITENEEIIASFHSQLLEDILPVCSSFSIPQTKGTVAYRAGFDKVKDTVRGSGSQKTLSVGLVESLQVYLDARQRESETLMTSHLVEQTLKILESYVERFSGSRNHGV